MKRRVGLRLVSLVMLLSWCSWVKAAEVKFLADDDIWTEEKAEWEISAYNAGCNPKYSLSYDKENKKVGKASLKVNYLFPEKDRSYVKFIKHFKKPTDISNFDVVKCWVFNPAAGKIYLSFYLFAFDIEDPNNKVVYRTWRMSLKTGWNEVTYKIDEYPSQLPKKEPEAFDKKSLKRIEFDVHNKALSPGVILNQENYILIDGLHFEKTSIRLAEISNIKQTSISTAEIPKILFVPKVKVSPKIDGKLNDLCWEKADKATDFTLAVGSPAKKQTTTYLAYDDKNLYIAFECQEPDITKLTKKVKVRDSGVLWKDDCIEIFLQTDDDYFHFILNTLNTQFDRIVFPSLNRDNKDWNPRWRSAISVKPGVWTTEIAIPFSQLKLASPAEGAVWRGNLCREEKELKENSSYFLTGSYFNDISTFGEIVFGNLSLSLTKEINLFEEEIQDIKGKIKKENFAGLLTKIDAISNDLQRIKEQVPSELTEKTHYQKIKKEVAMLRISFENLAFKFYALKDEYLVWQKNPLNSLSLLRNKIPMNLKKETKEINLIMGMNEEEMVSLVITNLKDKPLCGRIVVSRFKDGKGTISPDFIEVRAPVFIKLKGMKFVDDPLVSLNEINEVTVPGRENKEILFIVDSHKLEPGTYKGIINIRPFERKTVKTLNFNLSVLPVDLGGQHLRLWPYGIFLGIPEELLGDYIKDMADHRGNAFTMASCHVPNPVLDAQKRVKEPFEAHKLPFFNKLLSLCKEYWVEETIIAVPTFRVYPYLGRKGLEYLSPEWKKALKTYFTALIAHLKEFGFSEENIALFPYDETSGKKGSERFCEVSKIIREVNPKIKIFLTQGGHTSLQDMKIISPYVDIWCPNVMHLNKKDKMAFMKATGKPIWSYSNTIARLTGSPLTVRKYAWMSWKENLQGIGSWAYDYFAGDCWDDSDTKRTNRAYIYLGKRGPIPSRRWEAFREAMEDYEVLFSLSSAIKEAKNKKVDTSLSQKLLNEAVNRVLKSGNPDIISQYKVEILKEIMRLQNL